MAKRKTKLQECFDDFNHRYFDDRLHDVELSWANQPRVDGERVDAYCSCHEDLYRSNSIVLSRALRRKSWMWKLVLLHEMNHLDLHQKGSEDYSHGSEFNSGMLRLAKIGALDGLW